MARRVSIRRFVLAAVAAVLGVATVRFSSSYYEYDRRFHEWVDARPMSVSVDLSKAGVFTAPFKQTCSMSHGETVYLAVKPPLASAAEAEKLLAGLKSRIIILDDAGEETQALEIVPDVAPHGNSLPLHKAILVAYFRPFSTGDYIARIEVTQGAAALKGIEQTLFAKYFLCGLERFPATISLVLAFLCGISAALFAVISVLRFRKYGILVAPHRVTNSTGQQRPV